MVKFGWDKLKRLLAQANTWTGQQTFSNIAVTGGTIGGAIDLARISGFCWVCIVPYRSKHVLSFNFLAHSDEHDLYLVSNLIGVSQMGHRL